jgi:hypothetical protein
LYKLGLPTMKIYQGHECLYCHAFRPYNATSAEMIAIPDCNAPDGDGHAWHQVRGIEYADGEPCDHVGCRNHVSHPCENCGRIQAKGIARVRTYFW